MAYALASQGCLALSLLQESRDKTTAGSAKRAALHAAAPDNYGDRFLWTKIEAAAGNGSATAAKQTAAGKRAEAVSGEACSKQAAQVTGAGKGWAASLGAAAANEAAVDKAAAPASGTTTDKAAAAGLGGEGLDATEALLHGGAAKLQQLGAGSRIHKPSYGGQQARASAVHASAQHMPALLAC